jgi:hypothetical protein
LYSVRWFRPAREPQRAALNESKGYAERVQSLEAIPLATREMVLEDLVLTSP